MDGTKELVATNRDRNARLLIEAASKLLASVTDSDSSGKSFPRSAAELLRLVRAIVDKKMPAMSDRAVASLLFLRLVNPALCSPDVFLGVAEPAPHTRRTLILLSKLLQNLANGVMFGEKESYLEFANGWIASSRSQLSSFVFDTVFGIRKVRDFPCCDVFFQGWFQAAPVHQTVYPSPAEVVSGLRWIHNFFCARKKHVTSDKFLDSYFKIGADAKKRKATFVSQMRRATNNFHHLQQDDMPQDWVRKTGKKRNSFV